MNSFRVTVNDMNRLEIWDWIFDNTVGDVRILSEKEASVLDPVVMLEFTMEEENVLFRLTWSDVLK